MQSWAEQPNPEPPDRVTFAVLFFCFVILVTTVAWIWLKVGGVL